MLTEGMYIADRYEIIGKIGAGGMSDVYKAKDLTLGRFVAIKVLKPEFSEDLNFVTKFRTEAQSAAGLEHPNIVNIYDVGSEKGMHYIVMEYVEGITLKTYIEKKGQLSFKEAVSIAIQVGRGIEAAHSKGIIHRDIKPQNIMLLQDGTIKVTDFGIARFSDKSTRTMTEQAIGSVHYIAPEQARGDATDGKTDIYSVGVMLYEMLTGKLPFDGDSAVTIALMQLQSTPKRPREINPGIPIGLEQITMKAMEKLPSNRYTSAAEMLSDIERFRLNPSIVFDYGNKSFVDDQPTKFVHSLRDSGGVDKKVADDATKVVDMPEEDVVVKEEKFADEDFVKEHKPSYYAIKGIVIAALAVCAIFFALAMLRGCSTSQAKDVEVPDYVGKSFVSIKENNPNNFQFEVKSEYDESKEMGVILDQEPKGGSMKVKSGSTITVTVNGKDTEVSVPFITNYSESEASQALKDKNLIPEIIYVENTKTPKGYTIECFPKAGVKTTIGSTVYVYVAGGKRTDKVTLPSVDGLTLSEAKKTLVDLGLTVETVTDDDSKEPKDTVLGMSPLQYGKVDAGSVITLTVSSGLGDVNTVNIFVDLPSDVENSVDMTVIVDGAVDSQNSKTLVPKYNKTYTLELKGSGTSTVVIQLDGQAYREYSVDFATSTVTTTASYDYVVTTTAPPETEPPTQYYTDPYVEPDTTVQPYTEDPEL